MNLVLWILFGALVGWLGTLIANETKIHRIINMIFYGIIGGVAGGWVANIICNEPLNGFNIYSVLSAVLSSALTTWTYTTVDH